MKRLALLILILAAAGMPARPAMANDGKVQGQIGASAKVDGPGVAAFIPIVPASMKEHTLFFLKGPHASLVVPASPAFEMDVDNVRYVDPAHFEPVIIRLQTSDPGQRDIGTQTTSVNVRSGTNTANPISDDRVPVKIELLSAGRLRITPVQPLAPGEYGVAMRDPGVQPYTYTSSGAPAGGQQPMSNQQQYQTMVWDFSVAGAQ